MTEKNDIFVILDGNSLLHRCYHALPKTFKSKDGVLINALYGFISSFLYIYNNFKPTHFAVAFDKKGPTFRHEEYKEYKATRVKAPDDLYAQIPLIKKFLEEANIKIFEKSGFEADDMMASLAKEISDQDKTAKIFIFSSDQDLLQTVTDQVSLANFKKIGREINIYTPEEIKKKFHFSPRQIIDYKSLKGDPSDNIKGVNGIGDKTAKKLIMEFGSLENIYANLEKISRTIREKLEKDKESGFLSKRLATLIDKVEMEMEIKKLETHNLNLDKIAAFFEEYRFFSLLNRMAGIFPRMKQPEKIIVSAPKKIENIQQSLF